MRDEHEVVGHCLRVRAGETADKGLDDLGKFGFRNYLGITELQARMLARDRESNLKVPTAY